MNLVGEVVVDVLEDYAVATSEEREDVLYKLLFVGCEFLPVVHVFAHIDLLRRPVAHLSFFVELPQVRVLQWKHGKPVERLG